MSDILMIGMILKSRFDVEFVLNLSRFFRNCSPRCLKSTNIKPKVESATNDDEIRWNNGEPQEKGDVHNNHQFFIIQW